MFDINGLIGCYRLSRDASQKQKSRREVADDDDIPSDLPDLTDVSLSDSDNDDNVKEYVTGLYVVNMY